MSDSYYTTETQLHTAVAMYLDAALPRDAFWWATVNEGKRGWRDQTKIRRHGLRAGYPDISICHGGQLYCIELKRPKTPGKRAGQISKAQQATMDALSIAGAEVAVCYSLVDVQEFLQGRMNLRARAA